MKNDELAEKAFLFFHLQMWRDDGKPWKDIEPWERQAWRDVVVFIQSRG